MDHRNKIQSLVLPTYDPGDAPDCITEYGPCTCEYGCMCHTAPTDQKFGFFLQPKLYLAFLVRPEPSNSYGQARNMANSAQTAESTPVGPKKSRFFLRKSAILQSLMRGTAKRHGFLHIGAHVVAKGVLGHMGQIHLISTCIEGKSANFSKLGFSLQPKLD